MQQLALGVTFFMSNLTIENFLLSFDRYIVQKGQKEFILQKFSYQNLVILGCKSRLFWPHVISESYNLVLYTQSF